MFHSQQKTVDAMSSMCCTDRRCTSWWKAGGRESWNVTK